jgi:hypothetical protein
MYPFVPAISHTVVQHPRTSRDDVGSKRHLQARNACKDQYTNNQIGSVLMMFIMSVVMTIRTGRCAAHSAPWLTWVPATGLAQHHPPPEVARELAHFLWQWHRLIEIGQELTETSSSCHVFFLPITFVPLYHAPISKRVPRTPLYQGSARSFALRALATPPALHEGRLGKR